MNEPAWIMLPPARRGAKCPVSGWSRAKLQQLIYGVPSAGIGPKVTYRHVPGGRGDKGRIYINVPALRRHMLGECEVTAETLNAVSILSQSPDWCQSAIHSLLILINDRAGLSAADFLTYIKTTIHGPEIPLCPEPPDRRHNLPDHVRKIRAAKTPA